MTDTATATLTIPAQALEQARAKLAESESHLRSMAWKALQADRLTLKGNAELGGYRHNLLSFADAIKEILSLTAQDKQSND